MEPIEMPIEDVLDLHTFSPKEVPDLLDDYFTECLKKNILSVRIIHGKGSGILKKRVESVLQRHRLVRDFKPAPPGAGGWGATIVDLRSPPA